MVKAWNRTSFWVRTFESARATGTWVCVKRRYNATTAAQLVSDICNAHRRDLGALRVRGIHKGERWVARWEPDPESPDGSCLVWIRLVN